MHEFSLFSIYAQTNTIFSSRESLTKFGFSTNFSHDLKCYVPFSCQENSHHMVYIPDDNRYSQYFGIPASPGHLSEENYVTK